MQCSTDRVCSACGQEKAALYARTSHPEEKVWACCPGHARIAVERGAARIGGPMDDKKRDWDGEFDSLIAEAWKMESVLRRGRAVVQIIDVMRDFSAVIARGVNPRIPPPRPFNPDGGPPKDHREVDVVRGEPGIREETLAPLLKTAERALDYAKDILEPASSQPRYVKGDIQYAVVLTLMIDFYDALKPLKDALMDGNGFAAEYQNAVGAFERLKDRATRAMRSPGLYESAATKGNYLARLPKELVDMVDEQERRLPTPSKPLPVSEFPLPTDRTPLPLWQFPPPSQ